MPLLDLLKFCYELPARRNKAALLLTPDLRPQRACAAQIAAATGATHFDVLDAFQADATLTERLSGFSSDDFFALVAARKRSRFSLSAAWSSSSPRGSARTTRRK
jgi:hypothetical protein